MLRKALAKTAVTSLALIAASAFAAVEKVEKPGELCEKASGWSTHMAEKCATEYSTSTRNVSFIRAESRSHGADCQAVIDTPVGPRYFFGVDLYQDTDKEGEYWLHSKGCYLGSKDPYL